MKKYVYFELIDKKPKTNVYEVRTKSDDFVLGIVKWYFPWRQYCFFPVNWKSLIEQVEALRLGLSKHDDIDVVRLSDVLRLLKDNELVFSRGCWKQVDDFIEKLMTERKRGKRNHECIRNA